MTGYPCSGSFAAPLKSICVHPEPGNDFITAFGLIGYPGTSLLHATICNYDILQCIRIQLDDLHALPIGNLYTRIIGRQ